MKLATGILITVGLVLAGRPAYGWLRPCYEDITIVQRSELIVVGRLKRGSVISASPGEGYSQYRARLAITNVLKGTIDDAEIPVIIYHGLTPLIGGYINEGGVMMDLRPLYGETRKDAIHIIDTGGDTTFDPLVSDAGEDNLWFLRRRSGNDGREAGTGNFGIVDPEDVQPLSLQDYFLAYLSADPEAGVKTQLALHPEIARRAQRYLDHMEVQRILVLPDPDTRIQRLLPFYIKGQFWAAGPPTHHFEARRGIVDCRETSAPYLQRLFQDPGLVNLRKDVIDMLGEASIRARIHIMQLIELLEEHDRFWSGQHLEEGWWNNDPDSELTRQRRRLYEEILSSLVTLGKIGDDSAVSAINQTKATWERINNPSSHRIVKQCDEALRLIEARKHNADK